MRILDLLFPKKCLGCGVFGAYICAECVNKLSVVQHQKCPMCEGRSVTGRTHKRCVSAWGMDGLVAGFRFRGVIRRMIGKYKFSYVTDLLEDLSEAMISFGEMEILFNNNFSVVTCVPLHKSKLKDRGFNQSELIARKIAEYLRVPFDEQVLKRVRKTKTQSGLERKERIKNVKGAFELSGEVRGKPHTRASSVQGKKILLVDDVWTTGSTMRECASLLKRKGAEEVWGMVLAM